MDRKLQGLLASALIAGLAAGSVALANDPAPAHDDKAPKKEKAGCKGKKGKKAKGAKGGCKGENGCGGNGCKEGAKKEEHHDAH